MTEITIAILVAITIGLVQIFKNFVEDSRWHPVASLVFGLGLSALVFRPDMTEIIFNGIIIGLTASGLYSGTKALSGN